MMGAWQTDPETGLMYPEGHPGYDTPDDNSGGGLTEQGASVITGAFDAIADITGDVLKFISSQDDQPTGAGVNLPPVNIPQAGGIQPITLMAIGIPVALVAVAMMAGGRKK